MMTVRDAEGAPRGDAVRAVASFFRDDPARILTVAAMLRGRGRAVESTVEGASMGPTLPPGTRIRIELTDQGAYDVGDVVAFLAGAQIVVHRVVRRGRTGGARGCLVLRGDATLVPDAPVRHAEILGVVTGIRRGGIWDPVGPSPRRSLRARVAMSLLLVVVAGALQVSPRLAGSVAIALHRATRALRRARRRSAAGAQPRPAMPPGAD